MKHSEFKPHAFITLSNVGGIEIMLNRSNDGVYYRFNYGQNNLQDEEIFEAEIDFDTQGDACINHFSNHGKDVVSYSLSEAMRIQ